MSELRAQTLPCFGQPSCTKSHNTSHTLGKQFTGLVDKGFWHFTGLNTVNSFIEALKVETSNIVDKLRF